MIPENGYGERKRLQRGGVSGVKEEEENGEVEVEEEGERIATIKCNNKSSKMVGKGL